MAAYVRPWIAALRGWLRIRSELALENAALKQQLAMCERRTDHTSSTRIGWALLVRLFPRRRDALVVVQPETVVRWHRAGWRRYWTWKSRPRPGGRPRIDAEARELIVRLARVAIVILELWRDPRARCRRGPWLELVDASGALDLTVL